MPNYSSSRRTHALRLLRRNRRQLRALSRDGVLMYAIGLLVCDDTGYVADADLTDAYTDESVKQAAHNLIRKARI